MIKVLICEDNVPISITLSNSINTYEEIQAIAIINEGTSVYNKIKLLQPDIVVLDLKLPGEDGLQILDEITKDNELKNLKVVVYSGEMDYIQQAIKFSNVVKFLSKAQATINDVSLALKNIAIEMNTRNLNDEVLDRLIKMGFSTKSKGTRLLRDCIVFSINSKNDNMQEIYKRISYNKQQSEFTVKANIKVAVDCMWRNANKPKIRKYLRIGDEDKPSSKDITTMVKYYIERSM